jgi:tRNA pseudouridine38-40 synthase
MATFTENFDLELMQQGAKLFEGSHNFLNYCTQPSPEKELIREIKLSTISENDLYYANFFPEKSYVYHVHGKGFMRNQVRLMMGQLIQLGLGKTTLEEIEISLVEPSNLPLDYIAPPSGLILNSTSFSEK